MNDIFDFRNPGEKFEAYKNSHAETGFYNGFGGVLFFKDNSIINLNYPMFGDATLARFTGAIKHTWKTWHLVPKNKIEIVPPNEKRTYISLPGAMGKVDLTESLTGYPLYENREGSMSFKFVGDGLLFNQVYTDILNFLHGTKMYMILEEDPEWCYIGRFKVGQYSPDKDFGSIDISYDLYPYKTYVTLRKYASTTTPNDEPYNYLWDTFNFVNGVYGNEDNPVGYEPFRNFVVDHGKRIISIDSNLMHEDLIEHLNTDQEYTGLKSYSGDKFQPTEVTVEIDRATEDCVIVIGEKTFYRSKQSNEYYFKGVCISGLANMKGQVSIECQTGTVEAKITFEVGVM